jgi:hypothetical protein
MFLQKFLGGLADPLNELREGGSRSVEADRSQHSTHHHIDETSSPAPASADAMPAVRAIHRPTGVSFSNRTSSARDALIGPDSAKVASGDGGRAFQDVEADDLGN